MTDREYEVATERYLKVKQPTSKFTAILSDNGWKINIYRHIKDSEDGMLPELVFYDSIDKLLLLQIVKIETAVDIMNSKVLEQGILSDEVTACKTALFQRILHLVGIGVE